MAQTKEEKKVQQAKLKEKNDFFAMQQAELEEMNEEKEEKQRNENGEIEDDFWWAH